MVPIFVAIAVVLALGDVVLWLRYLRPTEVALERRNRLIAASGGLIAPLIFAFVALLIHNGSK